MRTTLLFLTTVFAPISLAAEAKPDAAPVDLPLICDFTEAEGFKPDGSAAALKARGWHTNAAAQKDGAFEVKKPNKWSDGDLYLTDNDEKEAPQAWLLLPQIPAGHVALHLSTDGLQNQTATVSLATGETAQAKITLENNTHAVLAAGDKEEKFESTDVKWFRKPVDVRLAWETQKSGDIAYTVTLTMPGQTPVVLRGTTRKLPDRLVLGVGFGTAVNRTLVVEDLAVTEDKTQDK